MPKWLPTLPWKKAPEIYEGPGDQEYVPAKRPPYDVGKRGVMMVLMDISASMAFPPEKMDQTRGGVRELAAEARRLDCSVGFTVFSDEAWQIDGPRFDPAIMEEGLEQARPSGTTRMDLALEKAIKTLTQFGDARKFIVIATDGQPTGELGESSKVATLRAAKAASDAGIEVMAIGTMDADLSFLELVATRKGQALQAKDLGEFRRLIRQSSSLVLLPEKAGKRS